MTLMLASVTGPEESAIALAGGADIIDLKDPTRGAFGAVPAKRIRETVAAVAGRVPTSAVTGDLPSDPDRVLHAAEAIAGSGVDFVKVGLFPGDGRAAVIERLAALAARTKLVGVFFADLENDVAGPLGRLASAGFHGAMLDTARKSQGRLLTHVDPSVLAAFVVEARRHGLMVGLAGGLEAPDVPRLLALKPDLLGFRGALCDGDRRAELSEAKVKAIRRLIPRDGTIEVGEGEGTTELLPHRLASECIFVRDLVLPVRIGAYAHEQSGPQNVRFDVTAELRPRDRAAHGMADVVSYDLITDGIKAVVAEGHVELVEELAERIAGRVLEEPRVTRVTVRIEKLELGPGGVGVEIVMERSS